MGVGMLRLRVSEEVFGTYGSRQLVVGALGV